MIINTNSYASKKQGSMSINMLTLFISLRCTQSCFHCLYGCSPERGEHMSQEIFNRSILIAQEENIPIINFFGGEPLLNPEIISMVKTATETDALILIATNLRPLENQNKFAEFLKVSQKHAQRIHIITSRDKFHLQFYDPIEIINHLKSENINVIINDYSDSSILLSEFNETKKELHEINTNFCCCNHKGTENIGILPDGSWTICPPSLEPFGNIYSHSLKEIVRFKLSLSLRYQDGCTECLKDFPFFRKQFENELLTNYPCVE